MFATTQATTTAAALLDEQREINRRMAARARLMVEVTHRSMDTAHHSRWNEFFALEVGALLGLTRRKAELEVHLAAEVVERLPALWAAMDAGDLDWARAQVIVDGVDHLPDDEALDLATDLLADAPDLTIGQLRARVRRACLEHDPADAGRRQDRAVEDRRVEVWPQADGTGVLWAANLPPDRLNRAFDHIDRLARQLGDDRTIDQKRADVMLDLLGGRAHDGGTGTDLLVTVDLETLIGLEDRAAEIPGWGPVIADIARQALVEGRDGRLRVRVSDPDRSIDVRTRRHTAAQRRRITATHPTCVFPGCRRPSVRSDIDHTVRHADGGPTHTSNGAPLCRFHHRAKDEGGWSYRLDADRTVVWRSPLGRTHRVAPRGP